MAHIESSITSDDITLAEWMSIEGSSAAEIEKDLLMQRSVACKIADALLDQLDTEFAPSDYGQANTQLMLV
jgi:hypothetical protein